MSRYDDPQGEVAVGLSKTGGAAYGPPATITGGARGPVAGGSMALSSDVKELVAAVERTREAVRTILSRLEPFCVQQANAAPSDVEKIAGGRSQFSSILQDQTRLINEMHFWIADALQRLEV